MKISTSECATIFRSISPPITHKKQALKILSKVGSQIDPVYRLISWLFACDFLSDDRFVDEQFGNLCSSYWESVDFFFNQSDPLTIVSTAQSNIIKADICRSIHWFNRIADEIQIDKNLLVDADVVATRILCTLSKTSDIYNYTQGYDRFVFIIYMLGLQFCQTMNCSTMVAEALAYRLSGKLISIADSKTLLHDQQYATTFFNEIDMNLAKTCKDLVKKLAETGHSAIHYALRWRILLFADEHTYADILMIWDAICLYQNQADKLIHYMILNHAQQVKMTDGKIAAETVQTYRDWDTVRIIRDSVHHFQPIVTADMFNFILAVLILVLSIYYSM